MLKEPNPSIWPAQIQPDEAWSIQQSNELYGIDQWGQPYFSINSHGHINVKPSKSIEKSLDLFNLVQEIQSRNLDLPLLLRFDDILEDRLTQLHQAFNNAIEEYKYKGKYQGVFPVKCNQQRHVVEELISCGKRWHFGLEAGSKAELLFALSLIDDPKALLICNGYKDQRYIETAILARHLGRQPVVVIEQMSEVDRIISASKLIGAAPIIGIRAKLSSCSSGRWKHSVGNKSKFGLSIPDILLTVKALNEANLLNDLQLLHFHIGSQINDIAVLKDALQEGGQIYVELCKLGASMNYIDVGGGLGIDYDGSRTATSASTNYSLQNYANDVVATMRDCCKANKLRMPTLVSESGRALASHFSILIFNILSTETMQAKIPKKEKVESLPIINLRETLENIKTFLQVSTLDSSKLQESWNDAIKFKDDALDAFRLGYIGLEERGVAEELTWACAKTIIDNIPLSESMPEDLKKLKATLASTYYANLSIFRSAPDTWAIDQLFPIMPIHRLDTKPNRLGYFVDLTCDSDGKLNKFINNGQTKPLLELHDLIANEQYLIGLFLGGAYQEVMGNLHNLFGTNNSVHIRLTKKGNYQIDHVVRGNTNSEVLKAMEHDPEAIIERLRIASESAIQQGKLKISDAQRLMEHLKSSLNQITYLQENG